jgi:hypothetical protein
MPRALSQPRVPFCKPSPALPDRVKGQGDPNVMVFLTDHGDISREKIVTIKFEGMATSNRSRAAATFCKGVPIRACTAWSAASGATSSSTKAV